MSLHPALLMSWEASISRAWRERVTYPGAVMEMAPKGGVMHITRMGDPSVTDISGNRDATYSYGKTGMNRVPIPLNRTKYAAEQLNQMDAIESAVALKPELSRKMGESLAIQVDADVYSRIASQAGTTISGKTIGFATANTDIYNFLLDVADQLDADNVPADSMRIAVLPPFAAWALKEGGGDFVSYGTQPNLKRLMREPVGEAAGFKILPSNNLPKSGNARTALFVYKSTNKFSKNFEKMKDLEDKDHPNIDFLSKTINYACEVEDASGVIKCDLTKGTFS